MVRPEVIVGVLAMLCGCERTTAAPAVAPGSHEEPIATTQPERTSPARLRGLAVGYHHACAWTRDGIAVCWGRNRFAQAGGNFLSGPCRPVEVPGLAGVTHMAAHEHYTCAVTNDGAVSCFGDHPLRDADAPATSRWSAAIESDAVEVATAERHACARAQNGGLWCWGPGIAQTLRGAQDGPQQAAGLEGVTDLASLISPTTPSPRGPTESSPPPLPPGVEMRQLAVADHEAMGPLDGCMLRDDDGVVCWNREGMRLWQDELAALTRGAWATDPERACQGVDHDGDGQPDAQDRCPRERETYNGQSDTDGCPDEPASLVRLDRRGQRIELLQKVRFEIGKDRIRPESFELLEHLAATLVGHPELSRVEIQGHSDSRSNEHLYGRRPTQRRAQSVRDFLVSRGVEPARLEAKGYGEDRPIASNRTPEGRALNRRIEVVIRDWAE